MFNLTFPTGSYLSSLHSELVAVRNPSIQITFLQLIGYPYKNMRVQGSGGAEQPLSLFAVDVPPYTGASSSDGGMGKEPPVIPGLEQAT